MPRVEEQLNDGAEQRQQEEEEVDDIVASSSSSSSELAECGAVNNSRSGTAVEMPSVRKAKTFYQMKCKYALLLCVGILLVHGFLLSVVDDTNTRQVDDGNQHHHRQRRDLDDEELQQYVAVVVDDEDGGGSQGDGDDEAGGGCESGHLAGLQSGVCGSDGGCLSELSSPIAARRSVEQMQHASHNASMVPRRTTTTSHHQGGDRTVPAPAPWLDQLYTALLAHVTAMQWDNDVYGSVAGLGAGQPQPLAALAAQVDAAAGEHFIVSDVFTDQRGGGGTNSGRAEAAGDATLRRLQTDFGLSTQHYHIHVGSPSELSKGVLRGWSLPQVRLVSIEAAADVALTLDRLERSLCLLRDGGIVVLRGTGTTAATVIRQFFDDAHGAPPLVPLLVTAENVYLCTSSWLERYSQLVQADQDFLVMYHARLITSTAFGRSPLTYFMLQR